MPHDIRDQLEQASVNVDRARTTALLLEFTTKGDRLRQLRSLATAGYFGCLPIARSATEDIVLRLEPGKTLLEVSVATILKHSHDGLTIAPRLQHLVAGRLTQLDVGASNYPPISAKQRIDLLELATAQGGTASAETVLQLLDTRAGANTNLNRGALYAELAQFDALFAALAGAYSYARKHLVDWLGQLSAPLQALDIVRRLKVSCAARGELEAEVLEDAWAVLDLDQRFDSTYTGLSTGPVPGSKQLRSDILAVRYLRERCGADARFESLLWQAAQQAADEPKYDGALHLQHAAAIEKPDAAAAYRHALNAARFAASAKNKKQVSATFEYLTALAARQRWPDIQSALSLAGTLKA